MAAKVISILAEKGGVGKTTLSLNLAGCLAAKGQRVLAVDTDKQGNLSQFYLGERAVYDLHKLNTLAAVLDSECDAEPEEVIQKTKFENLYVAPTNKDHMKRFCLPEQSWNAELEYSLRDFLDDISSSFDYVVIDTHPDLDTLPTWATLLASHFALTPINPERFSGHSTVTGHSRIVEAINDKNPRLQFLGYVVNLLQGRRVMHKRYEQNLRSSYGSQVFDVVIRNLGAVAESTHQGQHVHDYEPKSDAAKLFETFVDETLSRIHQSLARKAG